MLLALATLCVVASVVVPVVGWRTAAVGALVLALAVVPRTLLSGGGGRHVGIADATPSLTTYAVCIVGAAVVLAAADPLRWLRDALLVVPLGVWLVLGGAFAWRMDAEQQAGLLHLLLGVLAYAVGRSVGADRRLQAPLTVLLASTAVLQLLASLLQRVGLASGQAAGPQAADLAGRAIGTLDHPNQLAKVLLLTAVLLLPSAGRPGATGRAAMAGLAACVAGTALTGGRAGFLALLLLLVLWSVQQRRDLGRRARRAAVLGAALVTVVLSGPAFLARFRTDPTGGDRGRLSDLAVLQVQQRPGFGTGPNAYVTTVGQYDALTASGVPVHNTFLLASAELGVLGAVLLLLPLVVTVVRALRTRRAPGSAGDCARACVSFVPGAVVVAITGWGYLLGPVLALLMLTFGILHGRMLASPDDAVADEHPHRELVEGRRC